MKSILVLMNADLAECTGLKIICKALKTAHFSLN